MNRLTCVAVLCLVVAGCKTPDGAVVKGTGNPIESLKDLIPPPGMGKAKLVMSGNVEIPVSVETKVEGDILSLSMKTHGEVVEEERYTFTATNLALLEAASETYKPPLVLMRAPMTLGDRWKWKGTLSFGQMPRNAEADVQAVSDTVLPIKIIVGLRIDGGGPKPAERMLTFWLQPGKGIVRREFGAGLSRLPVTE